MSLKQIRSNDTSLTTFVLRRDQDETFLTSDSDCLRTRLKLKTTTPKRTDCSAPS